MVGWIFMRDCGSLLVIEFGNYKTLVGKKYTYWHRRQSVTNWWQISGHCFWPQKKWQAIMGTGIIQVQLYVKRSWNKYFKPISHKLLHNILSVRTMRFNNMQGKMFSTDHQLLFKLICLLSITYLLSSIVINKSLINIEESHQNNVNTQTDIY